MRDQDQDPPTITPLVRQYSLKAHEEMPEDTLTGALVSVVQKEDDTVAAMEKETVDWKRWIEFGSSRCALIYPRLSSRPGLIESSNDELAIGPLENQRQIVVDTWKRFCHLHPSENQGVSDLNNVPTIATLREEITKADAAWHSKQDKGFRAVKNRFLNFAETMNDYSYLFSIIPSGDKYTSLVTGVVSSVVKVCFGLVS